MKRTFFPQYFEAKDIAESDPIKSEELMKEHQRLAGMTQSILTAYSATDKQVGYVQGFNSIVAAIVYIFDSSSKLPKPEGLPVDLKLDEEDMFYTFYGLMFIVGWRNNFVSGMDDV